MFKMTYKKLIIGTVLLILVSGFVNAANEEICLQISLVVMNDDSIKRSDVRVIPCLLSDDARNSGEYILKFTKRNGETEINKYNIDFRLLEADGNSDSDVIFDRFRYNINISKIQLYHNEKLVFEKDIDFCNEDNFCGGTENYYSCPQDCQSYSKDGICIAIFDHECDPDCVEGVDLDCGRVCDLDEKCETERGENETNCPTDCVRTTHKLCGNSICDSNETLENCPKDCPAQEKMPVQKYGEYAIIAVFLAVLVLLGLRWRKYRKERNEFGLE